MLVLVYVVVEIGCIVGNWYDFGVMFIVWC